MLNKKVLIIANSVYHLINAINMKFTILKDVCSDILITDITPCLKEYAEKLELSGLFSRVIFGKVKDINQKYASANNDELENGFKNLDRIFRFALNKELVEYKEIYFPNFDIFLRMLAFKFYDLPCEFIWYEDGFSSYVIDYLKPCRAKINMSTYGLAIKHKVNKALLYEPKLAIRGDSISNFYLPKIEKGNKKLKDTLNYIFGYKSPDRFADFIFLEQSFRAEKIKTNDIDLMKECLSVVGLHRFVVKPHPRNTENVPFILGISRKYESIAPWELFLLNEDMTNKTVITVCSNAALTSRILFSENINTLMLYKLFRGKILWKEDDILKRYLVNFSKRFAGENYYVPETIYEMRNILKYLGGENE